MEQESSRELPEILRELDTAEAVTIIFPMIDQCLVLDGRGTVEDAPQLTVSPPLGSAERRLQQLNERRPHLPAITDLLAFAWTGSVESLVRSGVWDRLVRRMVDAGPEDAAASSQGCLEELKRWERRALGAMVQGRGPFHTVWSRTGNE